MRLSGTKTGAVNQYRGLGNQLWDLAGNRPSLDLPFSDTKSLVDTTTGKTLVDHTRASSGTYVGSDGLIKTATTNLLLRSEEFGDASWVNSGTLVTADTAVAPDGTLTADTLTPDVLNLYQTFSSAITTYTASVFIKSAGATSFTLALVGGLAGLNGGVVFSFSTNTESSTGTVDSVSSQSIGNGWYRVIATLAATGTASPQFRLTPTGGDVYIWGAQLEQSSTVGEYVKTTSTINSAPRFNHDPTTGESLGLLVEEQRQNLLPRSIPDAAVPTGWLVGFSTGTFNHTLVSAPARYGALQQFIKQDQTVSGRSYLYYPVTLAAGTTYTLSAFFDKSLSFVTSGDSTVLSVSNFSDATGTLLMTLSSIPASGFASITFTTGSDTTGEVRIGCGSGSNTVASLVFGAWQLEAGSFPTSYIPTEGTTVTRAADVADISGNNFGAFNLLQYSEEFEQAAWSASLSSVTTNTQVAPNGTLTADTLTDENGSTGSPFVFQTVSLADSTTYAMSCYIKAGTKTAARVGIRAKDGGVIVANFDLAAGTTTAGNATSSSIQAVGNGWFRCSAICASATGAISQRGVVYLDTGSYTADGTGTIHVWGAQLEQSSTATPYIKSDVTWNSRASNATYYDSTGTLKKSSYNLLARSEEFNDGYWNRTGAGLTVDAINSPTGVQSADFLVPGLAVSEQRLRRDVSGLSSNTAYTLSVYAKAGGYNYIAINHGDYFIADYYTYFDLQNGVVATNAAGNTPQITALGNGWYRCSVTRTTTATQTTISARYLVAESDNVPSFAGDGTSGIYIWGAQLETGTYAGDYVKTEASAASAARTNAYLPDGSGNFVSAGELLLEDAGTNLLTYSEDFSSYNLTAASLTANATTAPDGNVTATQITEDTSTGTRRWYQTVNTGSAFTTFTWSTYVKPNGRKGITLYPRISTGGCNADFNLETLTTSVALPGSAATEGSAAIEDVGNGWYRLSVTVTYSVAQSSVELRGHFSNDNNNGETSYTGDGTSGIYVWGAQLEASPYATSYIPTAGSQVTRAADVSTSSSKTFGNSWYRQDEGTLFAEVTQSALVGAACVTSFDDSTAAERIQFRNSASGSANLAVIDNSVQVVNVFSLNAVTPNLPYKVGFVYKINDFAVVLNGGNVSSDSTGTLPLPTRATFGAGVGSSANNCLISRITYWPTRLPNSTLSTITQ